MKSPAFQFYPKEWLSSPKILLMTPAQEGAYIRLLGYCWDDEDCSLPDDDAILAVMSRLNEGWFKGGSTMVKRCFISHPDKVGFLTNKRLLAERKKQEIWREKSRAGGKKSAITRLERSNKKSKSVDMKRKSKGGSRVVQAGSVEPNGNSAVCSLLSASAIASPIQKELLPSEVVVGEPNDEKKNRISIPHQAIVALYHELLPELRPMKVWHKTRAGYLEQRWREDPKRQNLDWWKRFFTYVRKCDFLMGLKPAHDGRNFEADLEWLLRPTNFAKVIEGKYANRDD